MPTPTLRALDCLGLCYERRWHLNERYYAELEHGVGCVVYTMQSGIRQWYSAQLFPLPGKATPQLIVKSFVDFTLTVSHTCGIAYVELRKQYPYFEAEDLLTLQCLIHEKHDNWRAINELETRNADAGTGEGVG